MNMAICAGLTLYFHLSARHVLTLGLIAAGLAAAAFLRVVYLNRKAPQ